MASHITLCKHAETLGLRQIARCVGCRPRVSVPMKLLDSLGVTEGNVDFMLRQFSLQIDGVGAGLYDEEELADALRGYRQEHPEDAEFAGAVVWQLPRGETAAQRRSVWDFL
jgi:hypothetical protein